MIALESGGWTAALLPEQGAAFAALTRDGQDLIVPVPKGGDPNQGFHSGYWMGPWTNRLDAGRIVVDGVAHHMPINRPAENNALHGFFRDMPWQVESAHADRTVLVLAFDRAPFRGIARIEAGLSPGGLTLEFMLTNKADVATPMGFGWHPFFVRPPGTQLRFVAGTVFDRDARTLPITPHATTGLDGADGLLDGHDTHFAAWDGEATITRPDGPAFTLRATGAWSRNLHVFAPPGAGVLCVEPVTHAPDAANRALAAAHGAMHVLGPGETLSASLALG